MRLFLLFWLLGCAVPLPAHGDEVPTNHATVDHFTLYGQSSKYELTLYYPELEAGKEAHLTLFVADYATNKPIEQATLDIATLEQPVGSFEVHPVSPGIYELHATFPEQKNYTLKIAIAHAKGADQIEIKGVAVGQHLHDEHQHDEAAHEHGFHWLTFLGGLLLGALLVFFIGRRRNRTLTAIALLVSAWGSTLGWNPAWAHGDEEHGPANHGMALGKTVFAPKETQFLFDVLTQPTTIGDYQAATTMYGTILPASGGMGAVVAPQSGRIVQLKVNVGQSVKAGQTLALLQQTVGTAEGVGIAANNAGLDVQVETARTRVEAAQREYNRLQKIADIAAAKDVQTAEATLRTAQAELQVLEQRAIGANKAANGRTVALLAPISGVVGAFTLSIGAEVGAGQTLFTVTNLNKVYVEAQVYDEDVPVIKAGNKFLVTCSTDDHKTAEVRLLSQALTMNPGNQSQRVLFEMDNPDGEFKIGEFVTLKALNSQTARQLTVPNGAITEINGKPAVFLKHAPETYELAYVQIGEDDGTRTVILKGFPEGERVVVAGAYEVKMMYLNQ